MTKILFSNIPHFENSNGTLLKWVGAGSRWPNSNPARCKPDQWVDGHYIPFPHFMAYAASYCAKHTGADVVLRDSIALHEGYTSFARYLQEFRPDLIFIESATPSWPHAKGIIQRIADEWAPWAKIAVCGSIASPAGGQVAEILALPNVVAAISGEYEKGSVKVANGATGEIHFDSMTKDEMNAAPFPMFSADTAWRYLDACPLGVVTPHAQVWSSRGCVYSCLSGDTVVNTVEGKIAIRDLVGREGLGVFTYDRSTKRARVCTARNIKRTATDDPLVRVHFDDGSHLDCTPDHQFLAFKWGNQHVGETEWACEAKDLKSGTHVRALKEYVTGPKNNQYATSAWSRKGRDKKRSPESRERYRLAAIKREAAKKARGVDGRFEPADILNHRVVRVEPLPGTHETFCLEIPETGWFYANDVLVKNCQFCSWPATMTNNDPDGTGKRTVRHYTKDYMAAFLDEIVGKFRFKSIYFDDDTFNLGNRHVSDMCEVMRKVGLPWSAMCRADTITRDTWRLMKESGCYGVKIGFESGVDRITNGVIGKHLDLKKARETVIFLRTLGMTVHTTWTLGHPGETQAEVAQTMAFMKTIPHNTFQISGTALMSGTPLDSENQKGHLDASFSMESDGNKKAAAIRAQLAQL